MGEGGKKDPPPGCKPIFIQMRNIEKYGLKTGPTVTDVVQYKYFSRKTILEEIQGLGVYCDFQPFTKEIEAYPEEEFMLLSDPEQVYGDAWLLVYTLEAKETVLKDIQDKIEAEEAASLAIIEEELRRKAEEDAKMNAVYEDKPIVPRPWASSTCQETQAEVSQLTVKSKRELFGITVTRPRSSFRKPYTFADRDTTFDGAVEFRSHKDPAFDLIRKEADIGLQAAPTATTLATQTTWYRPVNKAVQFMQEETEAKDSSNNNNPIKPTTRDAETSTDKQQQQHGGNNNKAGGVLTPEQSLTEFLRRVRPQMEDALQQNETVNIFQDAFKMLGDEDSHMGKKGENELKELRAFSSLLYSKNRPLAAIDWHPKKKGMVAVAPTRHLTFTQKMEMDGMVSTAFILVWDFVDFSSPQFLLQSPQEVYTFRFNTTRPNVVVGGTLTGQLLLWDITHALHQVAKQRNRGQRGGGHGGSSGGGAGGRGDGDDDDDDKVIPPVMPEAMSHIDSSHKRPVSEVVWLPPSIQVNFRGQVLGDEYNDGTSYQILSIAGDGQVLIWDTRYEQIADGQLPHIAKPRTQDKGGKDQLKRPEGVGELSLCQVYPAYGYTDASTVVAAGDLEDESLKSKLYLATEEGDFLSADWRAKQNSSSNQPAGGGKEGEEGEGATNEVNYVEWMKIDHPRPCVSLQKSPFFVDIYMTVGDWNFRLWKVDQETPIFTSPNASTYITVGRWSVTRPGLLLIAKVDGSLDVWDFTDTSYRPSVTLMCGPSRITSMEFLRPSLNSSKQQLLAVGDANGNLHIFDLPRNLWKPLPNEKATIRQFLDRELKKMDYVGMRMDFRREEAEVKAKEAEAAAQATQAAAAAGLTADGKGGKRGGPEGGGGGPMSPGGGGEGAAGGEEGGGQSSAPEDPEIAAMQAVYAEMEAKFIQELGLTAEDLPPGYLLPKVEDVKVAAGGAKKK